MLLSAYPDLLGYHRHNRLTTDIKTRMETASREAVTGRRDDITAAANGDVGGLHLLEKALTDIEQDARINGISASRIDLTSSVLSSTRSVIGGIDADGIIALSSGGKFNLEIVSDQAEANLRSVMSLMNTSHGNRKLFSGDEIDKLPLASPETLLADVKTIVQNGPDAASIETALDAYFNDPAGGFAANIYKGGSQNVAPTFLADGTKIEFSVRADNQAFKDTLRGLAVMATALDAGYDIADSTFKDVFTSAAGQISKGNTALIALEGNAGIYSSLIEDASSRQSSERLVLGAALNAITSRDQYDAAAELKILQTQLEASFLLTSRLSQLSLTNYIR